MRNVLTCLALAAALVIGTSRQAAGEIVFDLPTVVLENAWTPSISADQRSLYFSAIWPEGLGGFDLYVMTRPTAGDPWGAPVNLGPAVNTAADESAPTISPNGLELFFCDLPFVGGLRPGGHGGGDLWVSTRATTGDTWGEPVNLGETVNSPAYDWGSSISADGRSLYFDSLRPGYQTNGHEEDDPNFDLWMTTRSDPSDPLGFGPPVNLGSTVNSPGADEAPSISSDGRSLIFHGHRPGSPEGDPGDIWFTGRQTVDGPWQTPVRPGAPINSVGWDAYPDVSADFPQVGSSVYFMSNPTDNLFGLWTIYEAKVAAAPAEDAGVKFIGGAPAAVSADGLVVVGEGGRWTRGGGWSDLRSPATGVSGDGSVVVGPIGRWTADEGWVDMGTAAIDVSTDGSVILTEGTLWTADGGSVPLGFNASGISPDGSVVVGFSRQGPSGFAVRWTADTGPESLGWLPGDNSSVASAGSPGGSVVVGRSGVFAFTTRPDAYIWTRETGMVGLGSGPEGLDCQATAVSDDGSVVVGHVAGYRGGGALIWDSINGMRRLDDVLTVDFGVEREGPPLRYSGDISADGTVIVGGDTDRGWRAVVPKLPTLASAATGSFGAAETWDDSRLTPGDYGRAVIKDHTVTVDADSEVASLWIADPNGRLVVSQDNTLTVTHGIAVSYGTLDLQGTLDLGSMLVIDGTLTMGEDANLVIHADGSRSYPNVATGTANVNGDLTFDVTGGFEESGDVTLPIIAAATINGTFDNELTVDDHLGFGVFYKGLTRDAGRMEVELFQALAGDVDANGRINNTDLQIILGANSFGGEGGWDWTQGDFSGDGRVNNLDLQMILASGLFGVGRYGAAASGLSDASLVNVPEPSTIAMLTGVLGLLLGRLRRRVGS